MVNEKIKDIIGKKLNYTFDFAFVNVVKDIIDRIDFNNKDLRKAIQKAIDDGLIYEEDEWTIYKHYCTPEESFDQAMECFTSDIIKIAKAIKENN